MLILYKIFILYFNNILNKDFMIVYDFFIYVKYLKNIFKNK